MLEETRGGKREGAGRKRKGITKKVSLTLSEELWNEIDNFDGTCADYIRKLKEQVINLNKVTQINSEGENPLTEDMKKVTNFSTWEENKELTREHIEHFVKIYIDDYIREQPDEPPKEAIEGATKSIYNLFRNSDIAEIETGSRYRSPFSNKWYSSMQSLLKKEVPRLISGETTRLQRKKDELERKAHNDYLNSLSKSKNE